MPHHVLTSWWRHQMAPSAGNSPAVTRASDTELWCFLWFETQSRLLWRHCDVLCRLLWLISISAAFSLLLALMIERLLLYYSYPRRVNVQLTYMKEMEFPTVTICNQNLFRYVLPNEYRPRLRLFRCIGLAYSCLPMGAHLNTLYIRTLINDMMVQIRITIQCVNQFIDER